ncbi:methylated-DNA--[protein]-cysteine S-methyltransferase [Bacillus sp. JJ1764]|uniref:methylated-DNA--[protein]-cysteine S-methyltransferase n=1 Tax=Bacillus sp. JJ1764 TaxID=3122964 RepID=UPI0030004B5F
MELENRNSAIYWTLLIYDHWKLYMAATEKGLCFISPQDRTFEELAAWAEKQFPEQPLVQEDEKMQPYVAELIEYLKGERTSFTMPLEFRGTPFQVAVWKALCEIPFGETRSYSDIAERIQKPAAVRAVGAAIGANPVLITVPCHRVIGKNGKLTGFRGGLDMKKQLLELEQR